MKEGEKLNIFQKIAFKMVKNQVSDYISSFLSGEDVTKFDGIGNINSETAMKFTAVFACNRVLSETLASMPVMEYRKNKDGTREQTRDTAIYDILHNKPNEYMSPFNFKESCMGAINLGGNAVCQRLLNKTGDLVELYPYSHNRVNISWNKDTKELEYKITGDGSTTILNRSQVLHIPGLSLDGIIGLSPIQYVSQAIRLGLSYEKFGVEFYKNGANSSGFFKHPTSLGEEAFNRLKKDLKTNYTGLTNTGTPMLLEDGMEYIQNTINPADAQLIENKRFQTEDICRIYRVPLHLVQDLSRSTNNNIEQQSLEFVMYTMLPHFKRWEENINMQLLSDDERKAGYYIEFNVSGLLRGDMKTRSDSYAIARQWGWFSVNDIRRLENMSPIENGDIYLTPQSMHEAGKEPKQQSKTSAIAEDIIKMIQKGE